MAKGVKKKSAGRPVGAHGSKSDFPRDSKFGPMRCSQGFNETIEELVGLGLYKSKADVMHEALDNLAKKKLPASFYWYGKIQ